MEAVVMGRWKIEVEQPGTPDARYRAFRPDAPSSLLQLDEREARDLMDALIEIVKPNGHVASPAAPGQPRSVTVTRSKNKLRVRTQATAIKVPESDALGLFEALAGTLARKPERAKGRDASPLPRAANGRPAAWQCSQCSATGNGAGPEPPAAAGCQDGGTHEWVRGGVIRLAEAVQQSLPGHTVSIVRDAEAVAARTTSCRVDSPTGELVGVAVVTDEGATTASLDKIEARATEVARLLKILRSSGDAARYVEVNERGIRIRLR
jgi:hypothetical protein